MTNLPPTTLLEHAAEIASAYVSFHRVESDELPRLIAAIRAVLQELSGGVPPPSPAVQANRSVTDDFIICLEDGKKLRTLKRYLMTQYGLTPHDYRARWSLPPSYPMVAPAYSRIRSQYAKKSGLGRARGRRRT